MGRVNEALNIIARREVVYAACLCGIPQRLLNDVVDDGRSALVVQPTAAAAKGDQAYSREACTEQHGELVASH